MVQETTIRPREENPGAEDLFFKGDLSPSRTDGVCLNTSETTSILAPCADVPSGEIEQSFRGCFAVLVHGKSVRRHLYFNLPAAQNAVKRAHAKGYRAGMILVQLVTVDYRQFDTVEAVINDD